MAGDFVPKYSLSLQSLSANNFQVNHKHSVFTSHQLSVHLSAFSCVCHQFAVLPPPPPSQLTMCHHHSVQSISTILGIIPFHDNMALMSTQIPIPSHLHAPYRAVTHAHRMAWQTYILTNSMQPSVFNLHQPIISVQPWQSVFTSHQFQFNHQCSVLSTISFQFNYQHPAISFQFNHE